MHADARAGNVTGADVVPADDGHLFGINLSRGYPRFNPGSFDSRFTCAWRQRRDARARRRSGATMPQPAIGTQANADHRVIRVTHTSRLARVHFTTAVSGISAPGTVYRMDEIPISVRPALKSPYATDEEIVNLIIAAVARKPGWRPELTAEMAEIA